MDTLEDWERELFDGKSIKSVRAKYPHIQKPKLYASKDKIEYGKALLSGLESVNSVVTKTENSKVGFLEQLFHNIISDMKIIFGWIYKHPVWTMFLLLIMIGLGIVLWLVVEYLWYVRSAYVK
jgi:hypothetical protein